MKKSSGGTPREKRSLVETVANEMKIRIVSAEWQVGDKLPSETALTELFSVSRNTIRGALGRLSVAGLVETRHGSGSYVCRQIVQEELVRYSFEAMSIEEIINILEFRRTLEPFCARLAAERREPDDLTALKQAAQGLWDNSDDMEHYSEMDLCFHLLVAKASQNDYFYRVMCGLAPELRTHFVEMNCFIGSQFSAQDHLRIYYAIEGREMENVETMVYKLIDRSLNIFRQEQSHPENPTKNNKYIRRI